MLPPAHTRARSGAPAPRLGTRYPVLNLPKLEILFRDGSRIWLHQVNNDPLRREIRSADLPVPVNLRALDPKLESEVALAAPNDRPAVIFFHLRLAFPTSDAFMAAVARHAAPQRTVAAH